LLIVGALMQGADGQYWMYHTFNLSFSVIQLTEDGHVMGYYDLTGLHDAQVPDLQAFFAIKNSYTHYNE